MKWDHDRETDDDQSVSVMVTPPSVRESLAGWKISEAVSRETTELVSGFTWDLSFRHPDTLTEEEAREELNAFVHEVMTTQGQALTRCLMIFAQLPEPVVPSVLDQFQEIADYETRIWQFRTEHGDKPSIGESLRVLPAGRE